MTNMHKRKGKYFVLGLVLFALSFLATRLFKLEISIGQNVIPLLGLIVLIIMFFVLFKSKKGFLFIVLGFIFTFSCYGVVFIFWESYPQIGIVTLPIFLLLSVVFLGIGISKMLKEVLGDRR